MQTLTHDEIVHALTVHLAPGAQWNLRGTKLEWIDANHPEPTADQIEKACHNCHPEKEAFKNMSKDEKIAYLAKRLGLED